MRERRKLALAQRQLLIAKIARRDALSALAQSLDEEEKSAQLAVKSRLLANGYRLEPCETNAQMIAVRTTFANRLADLAKDADRARADAGEQAQFHREALNQSEAREDCLKDFAKAAKQELDRRLEARDRTVEGRLARGLREGGGTPARKPR